MRYGTDLAAPASAAPCFSKVRNGSVAGECGQRMAKLSAG